MPISLPPMLNGIRFWPQFLSIPEEGMEDFKILFLILWIKGKKKEKKISFLKYMLQGTILILAFVRTEPG